VALDDVRVETRVWASSGAIEAPESSAASVEAVCKLEKAMGEDGSRGVFSQA